MEGKDSAVPEIYDAYLKQAQSLSLDVSTAGLGEKDDTLVKKAKFVTPNDAVLETEGGAHLPTVPVEEAEKLNNLETKVHPKEKGNEILEDQSTLGGDASKERVNTGSTAEDASEQQTFLEPQEFNEQLGSMEPPRTTNPLFPPLPIYGPASFTRNLQCYIFRTTSFILSILFLAIIFTFGVVRGILCSTGKEEDRPFYQEEISRQEEREAEEEAWDKRKRQRANETRIDDIEGEATQDSYIPTEGGKDPIVCDVAYYARRVGLDMEEYKVQTEDGFVIDLWHIYDPREYTPKPAELRAYRGPDVFQHSPSPEHLKGANGKRKYPVLMLHGLLQSSGAYCVNDDYSLAFYLAKSNYDVWLGNNRCGFHPKHDLLSYGDPRMWNWNIRQMGVFDLTALTSRVLYETGFTKLGFIGHSQGTTQTLVALAKSQRPELGEYISIFCALAPAAYAGPLLNRWYFKFFRTLTPSMYKIAFGIHAFIPFMMTMHRLLNPHFYGKAGYWVFSYMFNWSNKNWDRALNDRMFQFAPVYVSAEAMRWWLGRDCFSKQGCILCPRDEWQMEDVDDETYDGWALSTSVSKPSHAINTNPAATYSLTLAQRKLVARKEKAWYDERSPPMAFWVAGSDDLVDGQRLLRRLSRENGREPCVRVVKQKVIENYEHLDVIWAIDAIDKVGKEVKECIWATCPVRDQVMVPRGCEDVEVWRDPGPIVVDEGELISG